MKAGGGDPVRGGKERPRVWGMGPNEKGEVMCVVAIVGDI